LTGRSVRLRIWPRWVAMCCCSAYDTIRTH
jgi:hypothetical protein